MTEQDIKQTLRDRGICVIIPTYNNGGTIGRVVAETMQMAADVIVVDDGSTDQTAQILGQTAGISVVSYAQNRGKGYALKQGFRKALDMGFAYAITLDADGQHYPHHIADFLRANQEHPGALIVGSRKMEGVTRSKGSSFANRFSNFWFLVQTGRHLSDTQTGYRLYPLRKLRPLSLLTSRYEAELELLVAAAWHGVRLVEIPIGVYYPPAEQRVSHFRPVADFLRISLLNTLLCGLAVVYGLPLRLGRLLATCGRTLYALLAFSFLALCVMLPFVWVYTKLGTMTEHKRSRLHDLIYRSARFIMLRHGIPGTRFTYQVDDASVFETPHVVICNHQSHLDLMCQLVFTPKIVFLTNDWVYHNPFYGLLIRNAEYLPVAEGIDALLPQLQSLAERGYSIAVYPEGTRSRNCQIQRFHQGAFYIAEKLHLPVLPMYLYGPGKVLPKKTYHLNKWPIFIRVGHSIGQDRLQAMGDTKCQARDMRRHYQTTYSTIANSIEQNV